VIGVVIPLLRNRGALAPAPWAALAAAGVLVLGSVLLYLTWSNWSWHAAPAADSPQTMVARLARQLEGDPKNLEGWLMLGRSYLVLQEYPLALRAFERADRLSEGKNVEALLGEVEALALQDPAELDGRGGRLVERALALDPDSGKALFFGATIAARRGDLPLARQRFAKVLAMSPPENVRALLEQEIRVIDDKLAAGPTAVAPPPAAGSSTQAAVRVNVILSPTLTGNSAAPLFVFVRQAGQKGPPLAAKRLESRFPQSVTLTPADAMMPGRSFAAGQQVEVVARIARSGSPAGSSGEEISIREGLVPDTSCPAAGIPPSTVVVGFRLLALTCSKGMLFTEGITHAWRRECPASIRVLRRVKEHE
jgi:cytochrome c-type biogenesis protein CcmH